MRLRSRTLTIGLLVTMAGGCQSPAPATAPVATTSGSVAPAAPSARPSAAAQPPVLGLDWGRAPSVELPKNYEPGPSDPPITGTHPILRIPGQAMIADVASLPGGGFVAVGYVPPDWVPVAWTSADGLTWSIHLTMGSGTFTFPVALAVGAGGTVVAVGRSGQQAMAWTSTDGVRWVEHPVPATAGAPAERMTAIVASDRGFVAGGSAGPELLDRRARFWTSPDGATWTAVANDEPAFANAEVRAITPSDDGYVAVGVVGTAQEHTAAVAWLSADGSRWTRIDDPSFADGVAVAVTRAPGGGLVAVGSDVQRRNAVAWSSPDGRGWTRAPDEPSRQHSGGFAWMTDVTAIGDELIGVGDYQGLQRGTATSWVSRDGTHWERARSAPVQEQGEFYAITPGGPGAIVVGSFGAPDSYVPTIWLSPSR